MGSRSSEDTSHICGPFAASKVATMSLFLVDPESDFTLELALTREGVEDVRRQISKIQSGGNGDTFSRRLALELSRILPELLDWDVKRPTKAQIAYAKTICYRLKIGLPGEALVSRQAMHLFIASKGKTLD